MVRGVAALMLGAAMSVGCDRSTSVTIQLAEPGRPVGPPREDGGVARCRQSLDLSAEEVRHDLYTATGGERCVVLGAVANEATVRGSEKFYAVRVGQIVPSGAPRCLGERGEALITGLPVSGISGYTLRLMVLEMGDPRGVVAVPASTQNISLDPSGELPGSLCLPWFTCDSVERNDAVAEALAQCNGSDTPRVAMCSLVASGGTTCPVL